MAAMTKRERVLKTVRFQETDRVPLYDIFQNDAIIEHYAGRKLTVEEGFQTTSLAIGRVLDMTRMVGGPQEPKDYVRDDGIHIRQERYTSWIARRPFDDMPSTVAWVKERVREAEAARFDEVHAESLRKHIETFWRYSAEADPTGRNDPTVFVLESGVGLESMYWVLGLERFAYLMTEEPSLVDEWLEALSQAELRRAAACPDARYLPVVLTYTDIAHKTGTLFSPDWLHQHWLPKLKRLNDLWHDRGAVCLFHSDGNLWGVMEDLVSAGIDGLNPLEPIAGMTVKAVREKQPRLFLAGGIDVSQLLTYGPPEEVRAVCRQAIADTGGLGYFMGSSTELHWDVSFDCARAMFESAWEKARK